MHLNKKYVSSRGLVLTPHEGANNDELLGTKSIFNCDGGRPCNWDLRFSSEEFAINHWHPNFSGGRDWL